MKKVPAWVISITDNLSVAVGEFELVHVLPDVPVLFSVPKAPPYCSQVFIWQNKIIPVMNLAAKLAYQQQASPDAHFIICIFAYRAEVTGLVEYGAIFIKNTPRRIEVGDDQACPLPHELDAWQPYSCCCFQESKTGLVIPILKLEHLFAPPC